MARCTMPCNSHGCCITEARGLCAGLVFTCVSAWRWLEDGVGRYEGRLEVLQGAAAFVQQLLVDCSVSFVPGAYSCAWLRCFCGGLLLECTTCNLGETNQGKADKRGGEMDYNNWKLDAPHRQTCHPQALLHMQPALDGSERAC